MSRTCRAAVVLAVVALTVLLVAAPSAARTDSVSGLTRSGTAWLQAEALAHAQVLIDNAQEAARADADAAANALPAPFPSDEWWLRIGRCEQPDSEGGIEWSTHGRNRTTGVMFVGGLGIMEAAWSSFNVYGFPPGWQASPAEQMTIARDIFAAHGPGAWGCSDHAGDPF